MSFFSSILSPFSSLLSPLKSIASGLAPILPAIGTGVGAMFGAPQLGAMVGGLGSQLFGANDQGQSAQQSANRYIPQPVQNATMGTAGQATGEWAGDQAARMAAPHVPSFFQNPQVSNASISNIGQRAGNMAGNWGANMMQRHMPDFLRGTAVSRDIPNIFRNLGREAGNYGQQFINRNMPESIQPYSNTRFNQIPRQMAGNYGRMVDKYTSPYIPDYMKAMNPGSLISQMNEYGRNDGQQPMQQPEQLGLSGMGYADGGAVYADGGPHIPSFHDLISYSRLAHGY